MKNYLVLSISLLIFSGCGTTPTSEPVETPLEEVKQIEPITVRDTSEPVEVVQPEVVTQEEETPAVEEPSSNFYTLEEVAKHNNREDCWTAIDGKVADVTSFFGEHPGGDRDLAKACGIDASVIFAREREHNPKGYEMLQNFVIGTLTK